MEKVEKLAVSPPQLEEVSKAVKVELGGPDKAKEGAVLLREGTNYSIVRSRDPGDATKVEAIIACDDEQPKQVSGEADYVQDARTPSSGREENVGS